MAPRIFVHRLDGSVNVTQGATLGALRALSDVSDARLVCCGRDLVGEDSTLHGLNAFSTVHVVPRLLGGGKTWKKKVISKRKKVKNKNTKTKSDVLKHYKLNKDGKLKRLRGESSEAECGDACADGDPDYYFHVAIVGAGAAGIGVAHALLRGGLSPSKILLIESGDDVGTSFRNWHATTRFISPSFASYPFGAQDLNAIVPDTAVHGGQHPSGEQYAAYLQRLMQGTGLQVELNNTVTKVERAEKSDVNVLHTKNGNMILCSHLVWTAGEWASPQLPPVSKFSDVCCVHYKNANLDELVRGVRKSNDPIVLVGSGEAGADLANALVGKGARHVLIVEKQQLDEDPNLDPSRRLSPITQDRLSRIEKHVETRWGTKVVSVRKDGKRNKLVLKSAKGKTTITTAARVVLCTGFDVSSQELWKSIFSFSNGSPLVNEFDESLKTPNVYLSGPMLFHKLTSAACAEGDEPVADGTQQNGNGVHAREEKDDENDGGAEPDCDDDDTIIFCFVYKFRTRFAVVAGEIIRRIARKDGASSSEKLSEEGERLLKSAQEMQDFYRSRGMLVSDLSCGSLACGMSADDTPKYGFNDDSPPDGGCM